MKVASTPEPSRLARPIVLPLVQKTKASAREAKAREARQISAARTRAVVDSAFAGFLASLPSPFPLVPLDESGGA
jgi:hypothetical protein